MQARNYGLKEKAVQVFNSAALTEELESFRVWNTAILNAGRSDIKQVGSDRTWNRIVQHLSLILGFMWLHAPNARPIRLALIRDHFNPEVLRWVCWPLPLLCRRARCHRRHQCTSTSAYPSWPSYPSCPLAHRYLSFLLARRVGGEYVCQQVYTMLRVLYWLRSVASEQNRPYTDFQQLRHDKQVGGGATIPLGVFVSISLCLLCSWKAELACGMPGLTSAILSPPPPPLQVEYLKTMKLQASRLQTRSARGVLQWREEGGWLDSVEVIAFVDRMRAKADAMVAALPRGEGSLQAPLSLEARAAARMVHDSLLVCTMYGYFPPPRSVLWASQCGCPAEARSCCRCHCHYRCHQGHTPRRSCPQVVVA